MAKKEIFDLGFNETLDPKPTSKNKTQEVKEEIKKDVVFEEVISKEPVQEIKPKPTKVEAPTSDLIINQSVWDQMQEQMKLLQKMQEDQQKLIKENQELRTIASNTTSKKENTDSNNAVAEGFSKANNVLKQYNTIHEQYKKDCLMAQKLVLNHQSANEIERITGLVNYDYEQTKGPDFVSYIFGGIKYTLDKRNPYIWVYRKHYNDIRNRVIMNDKKINEIIRKRKDPGEEVMTGLINDKKLAEELKSYISAKDMLKK